jgi:hypothetical protein
MLVVHASGGAWSSLIAVVACNEDGDTRILARYAKTWSPEKDNAAGFCHNCFVEIDKQLF